MRITGGSLKGRILDLPDIEIKGFRPTMDFLREVIFSSISNYVDLTDKSVLDLYSGSGIFSFECISRGSKFALAVEQNKKCCDIIKTNSLNFGVDKKIQIEKNQVEKLEGKNESFDIVFADPPYESVRFVDLFLRLKAKNLFSAGALFVFEERGREIKKIISEFSGHFGSSLVLLKSKIHGDSGIIICKVS